jgi:hypothetical protein
LLDTINQSAIIGVFFLTLLFSNEEVQYDLSRGSYQGCVGTGRGQV